MISIPVLIEFAGVVARAVVEPGRDIESQGCYATGADGRVHAAGVAQSPSKCGGVV